MNIDSAAVSAQLVAIREQLEAQVWPTAVEAAMSGDHERIRDLVKLKVDIEAIGFALCPSPDRDPRRDQDVIDLNTATAEELDSIPGLRGHGFEIVRYREDRGRFDAVRQLEEVPGLAGK